ncbi:hypothetical protein LCGC14_1259890, partial [marine sediment metagenome]
SLGAALRARRDFAEHWPHVHYVLVAATEAAERAYLAFLNRVERRDRRSARNALPSRAEWPTWQQQRAWRLAHENEAVRDAPALPFGGYV